MEKIKKYLDFINEGFMKKDDTSVKYIIKNLDKMSLGEILKSLHKKVNKEETIFGFHIKHNFYLLKDDKTLSLFKNRELVNDNKEELIELVKYLNRLYVKSHNPNTHYENKNLD